MRKDVLVAYTSSCCLECLGNKINHVCNYVCNWLLFYYLQGLKLTAKLYQNLIFLSFFCVGEIFNQFANWTEWDNNTGIFYETWTVRSKPGIMHLFCPKFFSSSPALYYVCSSCQHHWLTCSNKKGHCTLSSQKWKQ